MGWKINLGNDTPESVDALQALPGWYKSTLESASEDGKTGAMILDFRITGPSFAGAHVKDRVWNPEYANEEKKIDATDKRAKAVMSRLGLLSKDEFGREVEVEFEEAVGKEFVLKVIQDDFEGKDGKNVEKTGLGYLGMFPTDHPSIPPDVRVKLGLPLLAGQEPGKEDGKGPDADGKGAKKPRKAKDPAPAAAVLTDEQFAATIDI